MPFFNDILPAVPQTWGTFYRRSVLLLLAVSPRLELLLSTRFAPSSGVKPFVPPTRTIPVLQPASVDTTRLLCTLLFACSLLTVSSGLALFGVHFRLPSWSVKQSNLIAPVPARDRLDASSQWEVLNDVRLRGLQTVKDVSTEVSCAFNTVSVRCSAFYASLDNTLDAELSLHFEDFDIPGSFPSQLMELNVTKQVEPTSCLALVKYMGSTTVSSEAQVALALPEPVHPAEPVFAREESDIFFEFNPSCTGHYLHILDDIVKQVGCDAGFFSGIYTTFNARHRREPVVHLNFTLCSAEWVVKVTLAILAPYQGSGHGTIRIQPGKSIAVRVVSITEMVASNHTAIVPQSYERDIRDDTNVEQDFLNFSDDETCETDSEENDFIDFDSDDEEYEDEEREEEYVPSADDYHRRFYNAEPSAFGMVVEDEDDFSSVMSSEAFPVMDDTSSDDPVDFTDIYGYTLNAADYGLTDDYLLSADLKGVVDSPFQEDTTDDEVDFGTYLSDDVWPIPEIDNWREFLNSSPSTSSDGLSSPSSEWTEFLVNDMEI